MCSTTTWSIFAPTFRSRKSNPTTGWYVLKTNATEFTYLVDAVTIRQAPSIDGVSPPLRAATFEGFAPVTAVPEPETYAMLLAGLGLIGFAARRARG
jgi:hypothetical protein